MLRLRQSLTLMACAFAVVGGSAQQLQPRQYPAPDQVESFLYQSASMDRRYALSVGIPADFKAGQNRKYPALIVTDGDNAFARVNAGVRSLSSVIEPIFVVSIGTPPEEREASNRRRGYEFSPADWDRKNPFGEYITKECADAHTPPDQCTGGAEKFLNAIVKEVLPVVEARFPIDHDRLGLYGGSAGGFFAMWSVFQPNSPFKKYLVSSPAMARGDIFRDEDRYAKAHKDLPVSIYMGAGTLESTDPLVEGLGEVVSGMSHMTAVLSGRHYPGLKIVTEYHPGMSHSDAGSTIVVRGLRTLYPK
ncbi:MAG TPA: alpha/beta hydrolase-fold protein [Vicinamibacterales bacterium]|nr:alpha/beta hydrolase-fold protein [Vicinamibacterales bacterium]